MKLLVLDGNSILNRAFYGIRILTTKDGLYTNGIYGFLNIYNKLMEEARPDAVAVAFDLPAPTFRHKAFEGYKAGRKGMPEELAVQLPILKNLLDLMGVPRLEAEGFEADDILGTQACACRNAGNSCVIATGDRDSLQLVGEGITVWLAGTKGGRPQTTVYDVPAIREAYGVEPHQMIEVKALMGDKSDNIPGVTGIGEKTALDLIARYGSVRNIYDKLDTIEIKPGVRAKLLSGRESAFMSRELAEIRTDAPVETDLEKLRIRNPKKPELRQLLSRLEFYSVIEKMGLKDTGYPDEIKAEFQSTVSVTVVTDADELLSRINAEGTADFCAVFDGNKTAAVAFSFDDSVFVTLPEQTPDFNRTILSVFTDKKIRKRTHDIKKWYAAAAQGGFSLEGELFDTMLAGYLLNPLASSYEPTRLCDEFGASLPAFDYTFGLLDDVRACAANAFAVHMVAGTAADRLRDNGQNDLYFGVELPLARVLAEMEMTGFRVDADGIRSYGDQLQERITQIESEIFGITGYEFNINSTKQLGEALFVKLGLPAKKRTKTGYSTSAEVLEGLRGFHPIVDLLLEYRQLVKLKSTYTDGLLKVIAGDGRIHSSFNQVETRTGRISSTEPNLQNIPVRSDAGREMRRFFIPAEGCVLVDADYSQIELRILAHIADDQGMIHAFNSHEDIHTLTASQVFNLPPDFVTPVMRSRAKAVNFGIVYGIGAFSLSQDIGVSVKEADRYIKGYLEKFSGVRDYMEKIIRKAHDQGYVETLLGRRRTLPELSSSNHNIRAFGERVARNTPIQGTAADIIKIAMVKVRDRLKREGLGSRLILQVHDELIVEAPDDEARAAAKILKEEMENAMQLKVRLEVEVHTGKSWYDAKG